MVFGEPADPCSLWEKYKESMSEDIKNASVYLQVAEDNLNKQVENEVLLLLQDDLEALNTCLQDFGLPVPEKQNRSLKIPKVIQEEIFDVALQQEISNLKQISLNTGQHDAFCTIMKAVQDKNCPHRVFFINAPGGYGKTFLIEALLYTVREMGRIALAVASSGIAAELLQGGRTAHSRFKIPIPVNESSICSISLQSHDAKLMKEASFIIWDEIMMSHFHQVDCVDRSLQDIMKIDQPFGGIPTVFGGDPRQILPVVHHGNPAHIVKACIHSSSLWNKIQHVKLTQNM